MTERYLPLYRKYRPQTLKDLIGQGNIVKALSNAINLNKISHAYLLCGPRGTGKTSTARIIAKSLNCANGPTLEPCGECPSCKDIANSTPIDVIEIDAASNRKVEDARNILEKIQFVPVNGHFKIYIIDEVHMLTTEAFNTLLKTLEEPPKNVIFILATTEPHKVLDTIISRCQRFDFRRITTEDIVSRLNFIAEKEKISISQDALFTIARSSQGGMRDSLALLDQISVLDAGKEISSEDVNEMLGRLSFDTLFELSEFIFASDSQNAIILLDKIYNNGNEPFQIVSNLIQYFRNMLIVKNCADRKIALELTQLGEAHVLKLKEISESLEAEQIIYLVERLSFYSKEIKETTNRYLWLELCVIELSSNVKYSSYSQLIDRIEKLESALASGGTAVVSQQIAPVRIPEPVRVSAPVEAQKPVEAFVPVGVPESKPVKEAVSAPVEAQKPVAPSVTEAVPQTQAVVAPSEVETPTPVEGPAGSGVDLAQAWQGVLQNIESVPSRMFFYNLSRPVSLSKDEIVISFQKDIFVKQAKEDSKNTPLKSAALNYFGVQDIKVQVHLADPNDAPLPDVKPSLEKLEKKPQPPKPSASSVSEEEENAELLKQTFDPTHSEVVEKRKTQSELTENLSDQSKMVLELFNGKYIE